MHRICRTPYPSCGSSTFVKCTILLKCSIFLQQALVEPRDVVILNLIKANPGIRYKELSRLTGFSHGVLSHHLNSLQKRRKAAADREARITRYYPANFSTIEWRILKCLRREPLREILEFVLAHDRCTSRDIVRFTGKAPSTICSQLDVLKKSGLVVTIGRHCRPYRYSVADRRRVSGTLAKYRETLSRNSPAP